jgi:hypothetical protein
MSPSIEGLAPSEINSGLIQPEVPPASDLVGPEDLLTVITQSPKSEIRARGGVSPLTRMLACESELSVHADRHIQDGEDSFEVSVDNIRSVEVFKASYHVLQLRVQSVVWPRAPTTRGRAGRTLFALLSLI